MLSLKSDLLLYSAFYSEECPGGGTREIIEERIEYQNEERERGSGHPSDSNTTT